MLQGWSSGPHCGGEWGGKEKVGGEEGAAQRGCVWCLSQFGRVRAPHVRNEVLIHTAIMLALPWLCGYMHVLRVTDSALTHHCLWKTHEYWKACILEAKNKFCCHIKLNLNLIFF